MRFSKNKKEKMRRIRERKIQRAFKYTYPGNPIWDQEWYIIISKFSHNRNYYLLCQKEDSNEMAIFKLIHCGWIRGIRISEKKVLQNKGAFKVWLKNVNFELRQERKKYVLNDRGEIEARPTDYCKCNFLKAQENKSAYFDL